MRKIGKYVFRMIVIFPFSIFFVYLFSLIPDFHFSWFLVGVSCLIWAGIEPKAIFAWRVILDNYEKKVSGLSLLVTKPGIFQDLDEDQQGLAVFTSVSEDGLILYRGHIIPFLREVVVIPWENIESKTIMDKTPTSTDGLIDQVSNMVANIRIEGVTASLQIPWSKEIEMYSNIFEGNDKRNTNHESLTVVTSSNF